MLQAELEPADRSLTLLLDALREATDDPSLQAEIHQQLAEERTSDRRNLVVGAARAGCARVGEGLRDDAIELARCRSSRSFGSTSEMPRRPSWRSKPSRWRLYSTTLKS